MRYMERESDGRPFASVNNVNHYNGNIQTTEEPCADDRVVTLNKMRDHMDQNNNSTSKCKILTCGCCILFLVFGLIAVYMMVNWASDLWNPFSNLFGLDTVTSKLDYLVDVTDQTIGTLNNVTAQLNSAVTSLNSATTNLNSVTSDLSSTASSLSSAVSDLTSTASSLSSTASGLSSTASGLSSTLSGLTSTASTLETTTTTLGNIADTLSSSSVLP